MNKHIFYILVKIDNEYIPQIITEGTHKEIANFYLNSADTGDEFSAVYTYQFSLTYAYFTTNDFKKFKNRIIINNELHTNVSFKFNSDARIFSLTSDFNKKIPLNLERKIKVQRILDDLNNHQLNF